MKAIGIDVHGLEKGLHLSLVDWAEELGGPHVVEFRRVRIAVPAADIIVMEALRNAVAAGDFDQIADITYPTARRVVDALTVHLLGLPPDQIAIDSPSGFARNELGHGRLTEKLQSANGLVGDFRVSFQMTPSVRCGRLHGGKDWRWMVVGMASFAAACAESELGPRRWKEHLARGFESSSAVEVFPSATIQALRLPRRQAARLLIEKSIRGMSPKTDASASTLGHAQKLIHSAIAFGPSAFGGNDAVASLIAAFSTLPKAFPQSFRLVSMLEAARQPEVTPKHRAAGGWEGGIVLIDTQPDNVGGGS